MSREARDILEFGEYRLDAARRLLMRRDGTVVELTPKVFDVLRYLVGHAGELVEKKELLAAVWPGVIVEEHNLNKSVSMLRRALGGQEDYIATIPGRGYQFVQRVVGASPDFVTASPPRAPAPDGASAESDSRAPAPPRGFRVMRATAIAGATVVAAGVVAWGAGMLRAPPPAGAEPKSIAVLPLANLSGDAEQQYFVDGMTETLITSLAQVSQLSVTSRTSVMPYQGTTKSLPEIARELGVDAIVEGSTQLEGDRVRITAQLIDAATDRHLWARSFERDFADVLRLQNEIAGEIARHVAVTIAPEEAARLASARSVDPETYRAYLRGMHYLAMATPEATERGLAYLHDALDRDPGDALANAQLSLGYATIGHAPNPLPDVWERARVTAERAIALDPNLADGHAALALVKLYADFDWHAAEQAFRRANELNPSLAMNHYHYAWYLALFRRWEEAGVEHRRAQRLDPLNPLHTFWLATLYVYEDFSRYREGMAEAERALALQPDNPLALLTFGMAQSAGGLHDEAIATHRHMAELLPELLWELGTTYAKAGRLEDTRRVLAELEGQPATAWTAYGKAMLHAHLGELDEAFRWLAHEPMHAWVPWTVVDPWLPPEMANDPRFAEFRARVNLD